MLIVLAYEGTVQNDGKCCLKMKYSLRRLNVEGWRWQWLPEERAHPDWSDKTLSATVIGVEDTTEPYSDWDSLILLLLGIPPAPWTAGYNNYDFGIVLP